MTSLQDWLVQEIPEPIMEDAARWMAVLDAERCHEADRTAFARWLEEDPRHRWAFEELSEVWARLRTLSDVKPLLEQPKVRRLPSSRPAATMPETATRGRRSDWTPLVASFLVALGCSIHLLMDVPTQTFATRTGEVRDVVLSDGSLVELNARTTMEVVIGSDERRVRLDNGDAVFHVADGKPPFVVTTVRGSVSARDTSFAVAQQDGAMEVAVLAGRADVTRSAAELPLTELDGAVAFSAPAAATVLEPGEKMHLSEHGQQLTRLQGDALQRELSWRSGYVTYRDEPLGSVVGDMRRYSAVNIHLADERLSEIRISGRYALGDVSGLLAQLETDNSVQVDRGGPGWVVLHRAQGPRNN